MLRRTPIKRRTPLKRGTKRIRRVSKRRAPLLREYSVTAAEFKLAHPICQICEISATDDVHHRRGRVGKLLTDRRYFMAVCRGCHDEIHRNPSGAREAGFLK